MYVTTSWDDGDVLDTKVADLLSRYKAKGTFYITKQYRERRLSDEQIKTLAGEHEVGAHTLTHPDLRKLASYEALQEIAGSKTWLEEITGKKIEMFCYPSGLYNASVASAVREAGFKGARTVVSSHTELPTNVYEMPTTLHIYPFPFRKKLSGGYYWGAFLEPLKQRYSLYRALGVPWWRMYNWQSAARAAFDYTYTHGEVFHLWGHSWELEAYGMWRDFEELLKYIAAHKNIRFVTNSELLAAAQLPEVETAVEYEEEGGWAVATKKLGPQSIVYSFGAGEDITWDLEIIKKYAMPVYAFDPTPRSIAWLKTQALPKEFIFHPYGIGPHDGTLHFAEPLKAHWVSYSPARGGKGIEAPVKKLSSIMREFGHNHIDVLKMDIEGGEYDVMDDILASKIYPAQLLVEFHHRFEGIGMKKTKETIKKLNTAGYQTFHISPSGEEYSFIRE